MIEELEMRCWEKVHAIVKKEEGLALEYDESVICDVCRSVRTHYELFVLNMTPLSSLRIN